MNTRQKKSLVKKIIEAWENREIVLSISESNLVLCYENCLELGDFVEDNCDEKIIAWLEGLLKG